ncbi:MAG: cytidine deaminase [Leptotrichiaceae bacterium]|nr:cytidine deaminase [Leptotrichiaceae bacterium]
MKILDGKIKLTEDDIAEYINEVNSVLEKAYVPYSKFPVAALLIDEQGRKFKGVNVENASYGLGICAERNVIPTAVTEGMKKIKLLVVTGGTPEPISPCGACRQVIYEFSDEETVIILTNREKKYKICSIKELLPYAFGPEDL